MGVVAVGTEQIGPFALGKIPTPLTVDTGFPIIKNVAMAFATEAVALLVTDEFSIVESQLITILGVVAVETPPHGFSMMEHDILMSLLQFSPLGVDLHGGVAITARKHPFGKWRWRDRKLLRSLYGESRVIGS